MRTQLIGITVGLLSLVGFFLVPSPSTDPDPSPVDESIVSKAFDDYERLWIKHNHDTADLIDKGELTSALDVWAHLAEGQEAMRKVAFDTIASNEQKAFDDVGGYDIKLHAKILRGYK